MIKNILKIFMKSVKWVHKYSVPMLFLFNVLYSVIIVINRLTNYETTFSYINDIYANNFVLLNDLLSISVIRCLVFIYEGYIRRKCTWFMLSAIGLLIGSTVNMLDNIFHFEFYVFYFNSLLNVILGIGVIHFLFSENDSTNEPSSK